MNEGDFNQNESEVVTESADGLQQYRFLREVMHAVIQNYFLRKNSHRSQPDWNQDDILRDILTIELELYQIEKNYQLLQFSPLIGGAPHCSSDSVEGCPNCATPIRVPICQSPPLCNFQNQTSTAACDSGRSRSLHRADNSNELSPVSSIYPRTCSSSLLDRSINSNEPIEVQPHCSEIGNDITLPLQRAHSPHNSTRRAIVFPLESILCSKSFPITDSNSVGSSSSCLSLPKITQPLDKAVCQAQELIDKILTSS